MWREGLSIALHRLQSIYSVKRKSGCRSPMGARVFPESHSSWYLLRLSCLRPSARALFSHTQYILRAV